jgi:hypothetical protein
MRLFTTALLALVLVLPTWAAPRRATLELASATPLVVRGVGFGGTERVAVVAGFPGAQQIAHVTTRQNGWFTAAFNVGVAPCTALTVRAIGSLGSRAILQVQTDCKTKRRRPRR